MILRVTVKELAAQLRVSESHIRREIQRKKLKAERLEGSRKYIIKTQDVTVYLREHCNIGDAVFIPHQSTESGNS